MPSPRLPRAIAFIAFIALAGLVLAASAAARASQQPPVLVAPGAGPAYAARAEIGSVLGVDDEALAHAPRPDPIALALRDAKRLSARDEPTRSRAASRRGPAPERLASVAGARDGDGEIARGLVGVWDAFAYTGWLPASPQVAAGPERLVATVNARVRVFDKDGGVEESASLKGFFQPLLDRVEPAGVGPTFVTQPWVLYDAADGRFVLSAIADRADGRSLFLLAVSSDETARGPWCLFGSDAARNGDQSAGVIATGARIGASRDSILLSANMLDVETGLAAYAKARVFAKSALYDPSCPARVAWSDAWDFRAEDGRFVWDLRPAQGDASAGEAVLLNGRYDGGDALTLWRVDTEPGDAPLGASPRRPRRQTLAIAPYELAPDARQPGSEVRVSTGSASLHALHRRGDRLWTAHTVACRWPGDPEDRACARWYELDLATPRIRQSGSFGQPGAYVFDPEILPDRDENAVIVFNRASSSLPVEAAALCRRGFDPPGATDGRLIRIADGQGCYVRLGGTGYNRWGWHNGLALDPTTGRAWAHLAYAYGRHTRCDVNTWRTALATLTCAPIAAPPLPSPGAPTPSPRPSLEPVRPGPDAPTPRPTLGPSCRSAVDVMLVLDSSGSIGRLDYEIVRAFSRAFVTGIGVGPGGARVGIVQFSTPTSNRLEIGLTDDLLALNEAVTDMQLIGGSTDMDGGLQIARDELLARRRPGVPSAVVLMSDGQPNQGDPRPVAADIRGDGSRLLTIGVGRGIDASLMRELASDPADESFYYAEEFDALMEMLDRLVVDLCPPTPTPPPPARPTRDPRLLQRLFLPLALSETCPPKERFADVALVLDASTSMLARGPDGRPAHALAVEAARDFARSLRLRPGGDRIAVLAFNADAHMLQPLSSDPDRVDAVLRAFTPIRRQSRLERGIERGAQELARAGESPDRVKALVLLSDGHANPSSGDDAILAAWRAKESGIRVYVVGTGPDMNLAVLRPMADHFTPAAEAAMLPSAFRALVRPVTCPPGSFWPRRR